MKTFKFGIWLLVSLVVILSAALAGACSQPAATTQSATSAITTSQAATTAAATSTEVIELTLTTLNPEPSNEVERGNQFTPVWIDEVERVTNGRVKITTYWSNTLAGPMEHYDAAANGRADIANMYTMMTPGQFPMTDVFTVPSPDFVSAHKSRIWWELYQKYSEDMNKEYANTKLLTVEVNGSYAGLLSSKPIDSLDDLKGLKVQAPGTWITKFMQSIGASPVALPQTDVYMALQTGVVDASLANWIFMPPPNEGGQGWGELAKYYTEIDLFDTPFYMVMNLDKWNTLPAEVQQQIEDLNQTYVDKIDEIDWRRQIELRAYSLKAYSNEPVWLTAEELTKWKTAFSPIQNEFAADLDSKGLPGTAFLQDYLSLCEKYKLTDYSELANYYSTN